MQNYKTRIRLHRAKAAGFLKAVAKAHGRSLHHLARWGRWGICLIPLSLVAQTQPPNIVLIFADDIGYEAVSPLNEEYDTPNLDRLSNAGIRFDNAFSNAVCTPSRVKIMTGMSNVRNYTGFGNIDIDQTTFAHQLKSVGYATVIAGKWQLGRNEDKPQIMGFDQSLLWQHMRPRTRDIGDEKHDTRYPNPRLERNGVDRSFEEVDYNNGEYGPEILTSFVIDFIEEQANADTPFLAYYTMNLPHCPFSPTPDSPDWDPTSPGSPEYFGEGTNADQNRHFGEMVAYADKMVGRIESKLIELGIRENTLIMFIGDNGTDFPITTDWNGLEIRGGKRNLNDNGLRVPYIANWPGTIPPNSVSDRLVDMSDILPTFCEIAGAPLPEGRVIDGYSLLPEMKGEESPNREFVYIYYPELDDDQERILARTEEYMLKRPWDNSTDGTLYHFPEQYTMNQVNDADMTVEEAALKSEMLDLINQMNATKGSEVGPPEVPESLLPTSRELFNLDPESADFDSRLSSGETIAIDAAAGMTMSVAFTPSEADLDGVDPEDPLLIEIGGYWNGSGLYLNTNEIVFLSKMNSGDGDLHDPLNDLDFSSNNGTIAVRSSFGPLEVGQRYQVVVEFDPRDSQGDGQELTLIVKPKNGPLTIDRFSLQNIGTRDNWHGNRSVSVFNAPASNERGARSNSGDFSTDAAGDFIGDAFRAVFWNQLGAPVNWNQLPEALSFVTNITTTNATLTLNGTPGTRYRLVGNDNLDFISATIITPAAAEGAHLEGDLITLDSTGSAVLHFNIDSNHPAYFFRAEMLEND